MERIFLSLDYESFKSCLKVSKAWNDMLSSENIQRRAKVMYHVEMWMDTDELERKYYATNRDVLFWTTNNKEVAFIEDVNTRRVINFISEDGRTRNCELRCGFLTMSSSSMWELWCLP